MKEIPKEKAIELQLLKEEHKYLLKNAGKIDGWYKKHLKVFIEILKIESEYEHQCKCGAIIPLRRKKCLDCEALINDD